MSTQVLTFSQAISPLCSYIAQSDWKRWGRLLLVMLTYALVAAAVWFAMFVTVDPGFIKVTNVKELQLLRMVALLLPGIAGYVAGSAHAQYAAIRDGRLPGMTSDAAMYDVRSMKVGLGLGLVGSVIGFLLSFLAAAGVQAPVLCLLLPSMSVTGAALVKDAFKK